VATVSPRSLLSERIVSKSSAGRFTEVRVFVMAGVYLGGIRHSSDSPQTNYWQGGEAEPLDAATSALLRPAALEAVRRLDAVADSISRLAAPPESDLTRVVY
jgi:hypothetical protein